MAKMSEGDLNELAFRVKDLLVENGAVRPEEDAEVEHCMTVSEICQRIGLNEGEWIPIQLHLFRLGESLALMGGRGFYNGTSGEQATIMSWRAKVAKAHIQALANMVEAVKEAGELDNVLPLLRKDLGDDLDSIPRLAEVVGKKLDSDLEAKLLTDGNGKGES
jgi:hypothetical protein